MSIVNGEGELQCVAGCCGVLQCVAACCSVLQCEGWVLLVVEDS